MSKKSLRGRLQKKKLARAFWHDHGKAGRKKAQKRQKDQKS